MTKNQFGPKYTTSSRAGGGDVDLLPDVVVIAMPVQVVEGRLLLDLDGLIAQHALYALRIIGILAVQDVAYEKIKARLVADGQVLEYAGAE